MSKKRNNELCNFPTMIKVGIKEGIIVDRREEVYWTMDTVNQISDRANGRKGN
jgi:hypothetical protein